MATSESDTAAIAITTTMVVNMLVPFKGLRAKPAVAFCSDAAFSDREAELPYEKAQCATLFTMIAYFNEKVK